MLGQFATIWSVDFEFGIDPDHRPLPVCLTARELLSGRRVQLWHTEFGPEPPYDVDRSSLFLSCHASAETGCHLMLNWPLPVNTIDLEAEFRCATTGYKVAGGKGILGALGAYGLEAMDKAEKAEMRDRILQGAPFTQAVRRHGKRAPWRHEELTPSG